MTPTPTYEVFIDGACLGNPGPASVGVVVQDSRGRLVRQFAASVGETTNNVAEYCALLYGLQEALRAGCRAVTVKTDSELLARQLSGQYKVRDGTLRLLHGLARHVMQGFATCRVLHIPREQNRLADRLAAAAVRMRERSAAL